MSEEVWPEKAPASEYEFGFDWSPELGTDNVTVSVWSVLEGIATLGATAIVEGKKTTVVVSGGTHGEMVKIRNYVTTAAGRKHEKIGRLYIRY